MILIQDPVTQGMRPFPFSTDGETRAVELPIYHRLDVRISRKVDVNGWQIGGFLEIWNVYSKRNTIKFVSPTDGSVTEIPQFSIPIPYLGMTVEF